ncbi:MAG: hypothetical protein VW729_09180 [Deltaproteobacteria bacterium]
MILKIQTPTQPFNGMFTEELRCFCCVVCGEEPIPSGARLQDVLQMMVWIDQLVQFSQNN